MIATAQQTGRARDDSYGVFQQLLLMPAPTPRTSESEAIQAQRPQEFYDKDRPPPDNASIADLLEYWEKWVAASEEDRPVPSEAVKQQLFAASEAEPERLARLLPLFSDTPEAAERIKRVYDVAQYGEGVDEGWQKRVREWLLFNSKYFLEDLLALAQKAKDNEGYVENERAVRALARVDWPGAEPLLKGLAGGSQMRVAALSLTLLYRHAQEADDTGDAERYRTQLQAVASDRNAPARARDTAIEALSLTDWPGRDDWYLSLFTDETLFEPRDENYLLSPLTTLFDHEPDKWIPVMTRLVESKDRAVQQGAASCLAHYSMSRPRRDAILPVLRWLSDPDWLKLSEVQRAWFVQTMDELDVPESVPGLIWIVENEAFNRRWAARTLAHYKDPRAVPALKKALGQSDDADERQYLIQGLLASNGMSEGEQVDALVDYATQLATPEGRAELERHSGSRTDPTRLSVGIGMYLARLKDVPESLAAEALARVRPLRAKNPEAARSLLEITQGWQARQVDLDLLRRIAAHEADAATIAQALERREKLRETVGSELGALTGESGSAQAVAAVLLADRSLAEGILASNDSSAKIALLACARLVQMPLNVMQVGLLLRSRKPDLAAAAERYLLAEDSPEARGLLWTRHRDEAFITGWRENIELLSSISFNAMGKIEEKLRAELLTKEGAPVEIFALAGVTEHPVYVVRVYTDRAVATNYEDASRYRERTLTSEELAQFKGFILSNRLTESGPVFTSCEDDCMSAEFLSLSRAAGRRLFSYQFRGGWKNVLDSFESTWRGEGVRIHYYLENEIKGAEVLYADEALALMNVWQRGTDLRVRVRRAPTPEEIEQEEAEEKNDAEDREDEVVAEARRAERHRRAVARSRARVSWRALANGKLGAVVPQPEAFATIDESKFEVESNLFPSYLNEHLIQSSGGDFLILAAFPNTGGLWRQDAGRKAARISGEGSYDSPLVTPDRKWAVAAKSDSSGGGADYAVRFNLQTGREYRVNIPEAEQIEAIAYIESHGKVLLRRARDEYPRTDKPVGPEAPEFYLLDAATGQTQLVSGVFTPLQLHGLKRSLQPTAKPDEYWAALPTRARNQTVVGRYNTRDFSFQPVLVVPQITFDSVEMWVDETEMRLYVVYEGQLLRMPLKSQT